MPIFVAIGLLVAGVAYLLHMSALADGILVVVIAVGIWPYAIRVGRDLWHKHFGADVIAILAIVTAAALGQWLAGGIILFMLSGGEALEDYALRRAKRELTSLLERAPRIAHRKRRGRLEDVNVDDVKPGDELMVAAGETAPVDGWLLDAHATFDESMLTGEPIPADKRTHDRILSGSVNRGDAVAVRAVAVSADSRYQQIVKLVREAEQTRAPMVRLADRYSLGFTFATFALATVAWFISHDPVRVLDVLVVATPCPLIVAVPVAVMASVSRAAKRGIVVKSGGALETLGRARAFVFDKTGTITFGEPSIAGVVSYGAPETDILKLAASLDQLSTHVLARSLVAYARKQKIKLQLPDHEHEDIGRGVSGVIDGQAYLFGKLDALKKDGVKISKEVMREHEARGESGEKSVYLAHGSTLLGAIRFADRLRKDSGDVFRDLKRHGAALYLLSGDKSSVVKQVAKKIGIGNAIGDLEPSGKLSVILDLKKTRGPVVMVGDGVNDAPALAAADVGIAMGAHGASAASETADIVVAVDQLHRVSEATAIARRMLAIATESVLFGMGVSVILMGLAAAGFIPPVQGALIQELLDVTVILNALRAIDYGKKNMHA